MLDRNESSWFNRKKKKSLHSEAKKVRKAIRMFPSNEKECLKLLETTPAQALHAKNGERTLIDRIVGIKHERGDETHNLQEALAKRCDVDGTQYDLLEQCTRSLEHMPDLMIHSMYNSVAFQSAFPSVLHVALLTNETGLEIAGIRHLITLYCIPRLVPPGYIGPEETPHHSSSDSDSE